MAVLDKTKMQQTKSDTEDKVEGREVNILEDNTLPVGEKRKHDITEDAWAYSAPPKAGRFSLKLHPAQKPVTLYEDDKDRPPIYNIAIEGEIVNSKDGEFDKVRIFPRVSTAVGRGKSISTAAGLVVKLGLKLPDEIEDRTLARAVVKALMKEPLLDAEVDWQAYSKEDKRVVYRGMHKFPQDEKGEPVHIIDYKTKSGIIEEIRASLEVTHWYGKNEKAEDTNKTTGGSKVTTLTLAKEPDEEEEVSQPQVKVKGAAANAHVQQTIEDELAELEDA